MGNRKARSAAVREHDVPPSQPDDAIPTHKTLYEIAAERQAELTQGQPFAKKQAPKDEHMSEMVTTMLRPDGTISELKNGQSDDELLGPLGQALLSSVTLTMLHFTLDVLVHHQYRTEVAWDSIAWKTITAFPFLWFVIALMHPRSSAAWAQVTFFVGSVAAGCYLVQTSNRAAYYAVMKRAPPLGTLWVWTVMEMKLSVALVSLAVVTVYFWWGEFSIFNY